MKIRVLTPLIALGIILSASTTGLADIPPADPWAIANCAVISSTIALWETPYRGVGPEGCIIKQYDAGVIRNVTLVTEVDPIQTYASFGGVTLTLIDGTEVTTLSGALGFENPQCSVWLNKPFIRSCADNALIPDSYAQESIAGTVDCLRFAHTGIDLNADGQNEFLLQSSSVKLSKGPCPS